MARRKDPASDSQEQLFQLGTDPTVVSFPKSGGAASDKRKTSTPTNTVIPAEVPALSIPSNSTTQPTVASDNSHTKSSGVPAPSPLTDQRREQHANNRELTQVSGRELKSWVLIVDSALETAESDLNRMGQAAGEDAQIGTAACATWGSVREAIAGLPASAENDLSWGIATIAQAAQENQHGVIGVLLASWLKQAVQLIDGHNHWTAGQLQGGIQSIWAQVAQCLLPDVQVISRLKTPTSIGAKLTAFATPIRQTLMMVPPTATVEEVLAQNWIASQESLSDLADQCGKFADPPASVLMLLAGALLETCAKARGEYIGAIDTSLAMVKDLATDTQLFAANQQKTTSGPLGTPTPTLPEVQITWESMMPVAQAKEVLEEISEYLTSGAYCPADQGDLLGLGRQTLVVRTRRPQLVLNKLCATKGQAHLRLLQPPVVSTQPTVEDPQAEPIEWALFSERILTRNNPGVENGENRSTPRRRGTGAGAGGATPLLLQKRTVTPEIPQVVAFTGAIGLVADLVATGAQVVWGTTLEDSANDCPLLPMFLRMKSAVIQAVPDSPKTAAKLSDYERELKRHGVTLLVAPTRDELQVLQVTRQVTAVVQPGLPNQQLIELQRSRTLTALESQRTVAVWPQMDDQALADLVTEHDLQVQILLSQQAEATFISRLQGLIMQVAPYIRVEVLPGGGSGPTIVGFSGGQY